MTLSSPLLCMLLLAPLTQACAATQAEDDMNKALMPHATLGNSAPNVLVHRARLQGVPGGNDNYKEMAANLRRDTEACVATLRKSGTPVQPPKAWPEYMISVRQDIYASANRSITYTHNLGYVLNQKDCSLHEKMIYRAELVSKAGTCNIDLVEKKADGVCDAQAHANAAASKPVKTDPAHMAQMAAMMKQMGIKSVGGTGVKKTILGQQCEVYDGVGANNSCLATGGSFVVLPGPQVGPGRALPLEITTRTGFSLKATDVHLDDQVNGAVFTPHLAAGFTVTRDPQ